MTAAVGTSAPLTEAELRATKIEVKWQVAARHKRTVSLLEVLQGLDINDDEWVDEDGACRFTSVAEALGWCMRDGFSLGWAEDFVSNMESPDTEYDSEVDQYDIEFHDVTATPANGGSGAPGGAA